MGIPDNTADQPAVGRRYRGTGVEIELGEGGDEDFPLFIFRDILADGFV